MDQIIYVLEGLGLPRIDVGDEVILHLTPISEVVDGVVFGEVVGLQIIMNGWAINRFYISRYEDVGISYRFLDEE